MAAGNCVVIDYGMGNLHSAQKALAAVAPPSLKVCLSGDPEEILAAERAVLPGVGAIRDCMEQIRRRGLDLVVERLVAARVPLLGVCVGMQSMLRRSDENGGVRCMGLFAGEARRFAASGELRVPHMGWNRVRQADPRHPLWQGVEQDSRFYFVHSYYAAAESAREVAATSSHGVEFCAALARDCVFATQFHPEKSQAPGLALLANFCRWSPC